MNSTVTTADATPKLICAIQVDFCIGEWDPWATIQLDAAFAINRGVTIPVGKAMALDIESIDSIFASRSWSIDEV